MFLEILVNQLIFEFFHSHLSRVIFVKISKNTVNLDLGDLGVAAEFRKLSVIELRRREEFAQGFGHILTLAKDIFSQRFNESDVLLIHG